ncbi:ATP-binding protein [Haliangium ochraceum]|uniref:histidine kinase n=1 Tax=Haliangium ochraceum (strain DSM 14365 / JCM 11303 / SMP-2) TaxID=502025 RepID=D0LHP6_HALO1|nr:ATP-binding protein [Haliangium ochraceum]ACY12908.1 integral membrane sensor signal transduction histidine kinase [Haliangium ochraceum DSM 14365]
MDSATKPPDSVSLSESAPRPGAGAGADPNAAAATGPRWRRVLARVATHLARIRYRLLLVNVMVVAVPLLGVGFARTFEREMLRGLEDDMIHQAELVRAQIHLADEPDLAALGPTLREAARYTRTRIRVLDVDARVLADSHRLGPPEGAEAPAPSLLGYSSDTYHAPEAPKPLDVSARSEIQAALAGRYGAATRLWENRSRLYLFSALPIFDRLSDELSDAEVAPRRVIGAVYVTRSTGPVKRAMYRLRTWLLWVLAAALAATAILSLFLAATIARPLTRLTRIAKRIASGARGERLALDRRDEIGQLARAFDTMTQRLDERVRYTRSLAADISHEFKSPLTSIRGAAELLQDGAADDLPARERFLGNIIEDSERLDRTVSRLLELSRIESEATQIEIFDYEALVREQVERYREQAELTLSYRSQHTQLPGRRNHLASVLGNLLENAALHAEAGTAIDVHVSDLGGGRILTEIRNRGPIISEAVMLRLWDRFFTTRAKQGGTGLGLAIVASIVNAHGGRVSVRSSAEEGTTFAFELPLR